MLLKKLSMQGFKSFADRIELAFGQGITAVVGPNGSGKSNISDAIRWVLGEQSAKSLRGTKMEDVIFSGSEQRRPLGLAEVTLTLDNTDQGLSLEFSEVTVTRRVYRSGESEYLINQVPCRLKDIYELFMDTGLGKDAYSLISQGNIDAVLSARPEDRRALLEEAAGIVKYKSRKAESLRKLEYTEQNLVRVGDIIAELEKQLGPLAEQAQKAEEYNQLAAQHSQIEVRVYSYDLQEIHRASEAGRQKLAEEKNRLGAVTTELAKSEADIETIKLALTKSDAELERLQKESVEFLAQMERADARVALAREKAKRWEEEKEKLGEKRCLCEEKLARWHGERQNLENLLADIHSGLEAASAQLGQKEEAAAHLDAGLAELETATETTKGEVVGLLNAMARLNAEIENLSAGRENARQESAKLEIREKEIEESYLREISRGKQQETEKEEFEARIAAAAQRRQETQEAIGKNREEQARCQRALAEKQKALGAAESRLTALEELQKEYDGYYAGVRAVLRQKGAPEFTEIEGSVAELIRVPAQYEVAMEVALGPALQNIVTRTEKAAKTAIRYLKDQKAGRVTFLPLDILRPLVFPAGELEKLKLPGVYGLASDLVEFRSEHEKAVLYLLGRTIVVRDLDVAVEVAKSTGSRYKVVTLDGDVITPGGAMTGGSSAQKGGGLLARRRQLEALTGEVKQLEVEVAGAKTAMEEVRERAAALAARDESLQAEIHNLQLGLLAKEKDLQAAKEKIKRLEEELKSIRAAREALQSDDEAGLARREKLEQELAEAGRRKEELEAAIKLNQEQIRGKFQAREAARQEVTGIRVKLATLQQSEKSALDQLQRAKEEVRAAQGELAAIENERIELEFRIAEAEREISGGDAQRASLALARDTVEDDLSKGRRERHELAAQLAAVEAGTRTLRQEVARLQSEVHQAEIQAAKWEMQLETLSRRLQEDHGMNLEVALSLKTGVTPEERDGMFRQGERLKRQIRALGDVNREAIGEYAALRERYEFLKKQHTDLTEAKEALYKVIEEIERTTRRRFQETFEAVQREFLWIFQRLFGGGRAELILTDTEDTEETGIDIVAQPPGKKPQSLLLLSGGERTLTAIALLMALLKIKPAPFCVLDEIDAALDEANVQRFASLLKDFSEKSQFIVVTHRRATMEAANALYGVTMEESGISKLISVKLEEQAS